MEAHELAAAFQENGGRIRAYISRMIGEDDEAGDLLQETFARAQAAIGSFHGESKVSTWLYSIATHACLDHLKSARRRRTELVPPETLIRVAADDEGSPRLSAALLIDQARMGECVRGLIDDLPRDQRMSLLLHDIEGMTLAGVADALDCSAAAAKVRIHRARKRLRALLEANCTFGCDERGVFVCEPKMPGEKPPA
jgi:RNA polymerase sigma-70 factor (ECF subfamily)